MADNQTLQPDYDAIAQQAYEWLKKRRAKGEISTFEVLMKIDGYKWGSKELKHSWRNWIYSKSMAAFSVLSRREKSMLPISRHTKVCTLVFRTISHLFSGRNRASATVWHI